MPLKRSGCTTEFPIVYARWAILSSGKAAGAAFANNCGVPIL
jgi:hypothetical protein